jgi:aromatic ring-opening dioxygenase LigB subunit
MLVFAAIVPHGSDIVEEIARDPSVMAQTRRAMEEVGQRFVQARPDTVVVLTPHGVMLDGAISVGMAEQATGTLGEGKRKVGLSFPTDLEFAAQISDAAANLKVPTRAFVVQESEQSAPYVPLDWGAFVPLWFTARYLAPPPPVVVMAPDRDLPREILVRLGVALARAGRESGKRVALLASCDQGHAHDANGPYGYDPASKVHDEAMCQAITTNELERLFAWMPDFLESAKVDSYWQTLPLIGAIAHTSLRGELLSYEAPTYFGMAVAVYEPAEH